MNSWDVCGDIANVIATALAALSIGLTIFEQRKAYEHEKNRNVISQKLLWYNELVLNGIVKDIHIFINESRRQLEHCRTYKDKTELETTLKLTYDMINDQFKSVQEKMFLLNTFSKLLYRECQMKFQEIFDNFSDIINEATDKKRAPYVNMHRIQKLEGEIVSQLYEWAADKVKEE